MSQELAVTQESFWPRYLCDLQSHRYRMERLHHDAVAACSECTDFAPDSPESAITGMANSIVTSLVRSASLSFTAPGCKPLAIDHKAYQERFVLPLFEDCREADPIEIFGRFSPVEVWSALVSEYGGDVGANMVYSEAAGRLVQGFSLRHQAPAVGARGITSISVSVWNDERRGDEIKLGYNARERLRTLSEGLHVFALYTEREDLVRGVDAFVSWVRDWESAFRSRQRMNLARDFSIVFYKTRFEFQIGQELTQALQVFVSLYAGDLFKELA